MKTSILESQLLEKKTSKKSIEILVNKKDFEIYAQDNSCIIQEVEFVKIIDLNTKSPLQVVEATQPTATLLPRKGAPKFFSRLWNRLTVLPLTMPLCLVMFFGLLSANGWGQNSITSAGTGNTYSQNFDAFRGTAITLPTNWTVTTASYNAAYPILTSGAASPTVANASGNNCYAGRASAVSTDYSILQKQATSGSTTLTFNTINNTGSNINGYVVSWNVEQFSAAGRATKVDFSYNINNGSYIQSSITGTTLYTASTGSSTTFSLVSTSHSITISGINVPNGQTANFRFTISTGTGTGSNAHIGIDDFTIYATSAATAPVAPTINSITPGNQELSVAFSAGSDGGSAITNYKYSTNGGTTWQTRSTGTTASPLVISTLSTDGTTALTNGTSYNVQIRAVNAVGDGTATVSTVATPRTTPSAPTIASITPGNQQLSVAFTAGSDGGSAITTYKYSTNGGLNWQTRASGTTASPLVISTLSTDGTTALTNGVSYDIQIRALNTAGDGTATGTTQGTPAAPISPTLNAVTLASALSTIYGTASSGVSFSASGSNLTGDITATAQTGYEVSTSPGSVYGSSVSVASGTIVYVRFASTYSAGTYNSATAVVLSGGGAYSSAIITTSSSGNTVSQKALTVTGLTAQNKVYNGLTTTTTTGTAALSGILGVDEVTLSGTPTFTFASSNVGTGISVSTTGYSLTGANSGNYTLTQPAFSADITARNLTVTANDVNKYAGVALTGGVGSTAFTPSGLQNGETIGSVTIAYGSAGSDTGDGNTVGVYSSQVTPSTATGGTFNSSNYSITYVAGSITVLEAPVAILQWNTFGNTGTETSEPSVFNVPNIASSNLSQGSITAASNSNRFGGSNWWNTGDATNSTIANAVSGNDYIQFIVTPNSGSVFTPTSFVFNWDKSASGPQNVALRSSVDNFASDLGTIVPTAAIGTLNTITISGLSNIATATTFRVYGYGGTATGGTGGFDVGSNVVNVQLNGYVKSVPQLSSPTATSIGFALATLGSTITSDGGATITARGTVYGTSSSPTVNALAEGGISVAAYSHSRSGLTANTLYYYRGYATNSVGTGYSADGSFTTLHNAPTIGSGSNATATSIDASWSAPSGGSETFTYEVQVDNDIDFSSPTFTQSNISSGTTTLTATGLTSNTTYYFRVRANNVAGNSAWSSTSTGYATLVVATPTLSGTSLTAYGNICINTTTYPNSFTINGAALTSADVTVSSLVGFTFSTTAGGTYTSSLTLSQDGGTYAQDVYVKFSPTAVQSYDGNIVIGGGGATSVNVAASGSGISGSVAVTTTAASSITSTGVSTGGSSVSTTCGTITAKGLACGTSANPTTPITSDGTGTGNFTSVLSGLTPNTLHNYRAYATNSNSVTSYGSNLTFTTLHNAPTVGSGSGATTSAITANWSAPVGGGSETFTYEVAISTSSSFASTLSAQSGISSGTTSYQYTGLADGTTYYFRVRAVNAGGNSDWSAISSGYATLANAVILSTLGSAATENFNSLVSSSTSSSTPTGWYFSESGSNVNSTYTAGTGSVTTGDTYSYGSTSDRAFGGLRTGSLVPTIGAKLFNNTGSTITNLSITYTGETWRVGATGRADQLDFQYSLDATSLTTGTWTNFDNLDYANSSQSSMSSGSMILSSSISNVINGLSLANGASFWIRWTDMDATGADDGMGVDDLSIKPCTTTSLNTQPATATTSTCLNGTAFSALSVSATGTGLSYQWQSSTASDFSSSVNNVGTNNDSYTPENTTTGTLYYRCVITNGCGVSSNSNVSGALTVNANQAASVSITSNDVDNTVCSGTSVTFTATPTNGETPTYQWQKNGYDISGETNSTYTTTVLANSDAIRVVMTSTATCATGSPANSSAITSTVNANGTWVGDNNDGWNVSGNWCGGVPNSSSAVVSIPSGVTVNLDASPSVLNLTIGSGSTLVANGQTITVASGGSFTNNGTYSVGIGAANLVFEGAGTIGGTTVTLNNLTANGTLTINTSPTVNGTVTINTGGSIITNPITYGTSSSLVYNVNSSINSTHHEWPTSNSPYNVTIQNSSVVTLNEDKTIDGTLTLTSGKITLGSKNLTLNGEISGGSSSCYINTNTTNTNNNNQGAFLRSVSSTGVDYLFPIGRDAVYVPFSIKFNAGDLSNILISSTTHKSKVSNLNSNQTHYLERHWIVEPTSTISGLNYDISLQFNPSEIIGTGNIEDIRPIKYSGGTWYKPVGANFTDGIEQGTASAPSNNTLTWTGLSTFSEFGGAGDAPTPLPIELISFTSSCNENQKTLIWQTASEHNSSHFEIEKSIDGITWSVVGQISAAGNSNQLLSYSYSDYEKTNGYYRLNQIDNDGKNDYFGPVAPFCETEQFVLKTTPNPSKDLFNLQFYSNESETANLEMIDINGRVVYTNFLLIQNGINVFPINSEFPQGVYYIKLIRKNNETITIKQLIF